MKHGASDTNGTPRITERQAICTGFSCSLNSCNMPLPLIKWARIRNISPGKFIYFTYCFYRVIRLSSSGFDFILFSDMPLPFAATTAQLALATSGLLAHTEFMPVK